MERSRAIARRGLDEWSRAPTRLGMTVAMPPAMRTLTFTVLFAVALPFIAAADSACTADVHDNTVNINAQLNVTAQSDVSHVSSGSNVSLALNVQNVYLVAPDQTPPPDHVSDAAQIQIYLDDLNSQPLLVTAQVSVSVTIPPATPPGPHKLRCRVHKHDGTPTNVVTDVDITVVAGAGTSDAGTPSDAGAPTADSAT